MNIRPLHTLIGLGAGLALAGGGYAVAAAGGGKIRACENVRTHVLTMQARCPKRTRVVVWNVRGPAGRNGRNGSDGTSVTLNPTVNVKQVSSSTPASASISEGSGGRDTLNLEIPQGPAGATGATGAAGANTGPNAYGEVWVGSSTAELAPGSGAGVQTVTGGTGSASVKINNCAAATPAEPIITVTPNNDGNDKLTGANGNTSGEPTAYVSSFGNDNLPGDHVLGFTVRLTSTTGTAITSDFSFTVTC